MKACAEIHNPCLRPTGMSAPVCQALFYCVMRRFCKSWCTGHRDSVSWEKSVQLTDVAVAKFCFFIICVPFANCVLSRHYWWNEFLPNTAELHYIGTVITYANILCRLNRCREQ